MTALESEPLSGLPLAHALLQAMGYEVFGNATGPFVFSLDHMQSLCVYGATSQNVIWENLDTQFELFCMKKAQSSGASFIVHGEEVICSIGGVSASGSSYGEAAMRALVNHEKQAPVNAGAVAGRSSACSKTSGEK
jgi:hypothetical protein